MGNREIVDCLGRGRVVETIVENIARSALTPELKDLCQMVYEIILEYDGEKIRDLWEHGQMGFFIARVVMNQYKSRSSPFHYTYRRYREKARELQEDREKARELQEDRDNDTG